MEQQHLASPWDHRLLSAERTARQCPKNLLFPAFAAPTQVTRTVNQITRHNAKFFEVSSCDLAAAAHIAVQRKTPGIVLDKLLAENRRAVEAFVNAVRLRLLDLGDVMLNHLQSPEHFREGAAQATELPALARRANALL